MPSKPVLMMNSRFVISIELFPFANRLRDRLPAQPLISKAF